jgi:hypothetical protein
MLSTIALIFGFVCIATYLWLAITGDARPFNWANALLGWPIFAASWQAGAKAAMLLNGFFTCVGIYGVIQDRIWKRKSDAISNEVTEALGELWTRPINNIDASTMSKPWSDPAWRN